eukprot:gene352-371_t
MASTVPWIESAGSATSDGCHTPGGRSANAPRNTLGQVSTQEPAAGTFRSTHAATGAHSNQALPKPLVGDGPAPSSRKAAAQDIVSSLGSGDTKGDLCPVSTVAGVAVFADPDGRFFCTFQGNKTYVRRPGTMEIVVATLETATNVAMVAVSPDGLLLALALADGSVVLWKTSDWGLEATLPGPPDHQHSPKFAFSPDGSFMVACYQTGHCTVWASSDWQPLVTLDHRSLVHDVAISPDSIYVATAHEDHTVQIWMVNEFTMPPPPGLTPPTAEECEWSDLFEPHYLAGCHLITLDECQSFPSQEEAQEACELSTTCGGITDTGGSTDERWELRGGTQPTTSTRGERSMYILNKAACQGHGCMWCWPVPSFAYPHTGPVKRVLVAQSGSYLVTYSSEPNSKNPHRAYVWYPPRNEAIHIPSVAEVTCVDDNSVEDSSGDTCISWYAETDHPDVCSGQWNDDDFVVAVQCCRCGGGTKSTHWLATARWDQDAGCQLCTSDDSTTDTAGNTCSASYDGSAPLRSPCDGSADDADFVAVNMCCTCGGGQRTDWNCLVSTVYHPTSNTQKIHAMVIAPDSSFFLTSSYQTDIRLWMAQDLFSPSRPGEIGSSMVSFLHREAANVVHVTKDSMTVLTGAHDYESHIFFRPDWETLCSDKPRTSADNPSSSGCIGTPTAILLHNTPILSSAFFGRYFATSDNAVTAVWDSWDWEVPNGLSIIRGPDKANSHLSECDQGCASFPDLAQAQFACLSSATCDGVVFEQAGQKWQLRQGPCDESLQDGSTAYRGCQDRTRSGLACQKWTAQTPHEHNWTPDQYPYDGLGDHSYCRNPDGSTQGLWCYTTDPSQRSAPCDPLPPTGGGEDSYYITNPAACRRPSAPVVLSVSFDWTVQVWDPLVWNGAHASRNAGLLATLHHRDVSGPPGVKNAVFSHDGVLCITLGKDEWGRVWKTADWLDPPSRGTAVELGGGNDNDATNLSACIGECDEDSQCAPGLRCFQRHVGEPVPGCKGPGSSHDWDYCYVPLEPLAILPYVSDKQGWNEIWEAQFSLDDSMLITSSSRTGAKVWNVTEFFADGDATPLAGTEDNDAENLLACTGECDTDRDYGEQIPGCTGPGSGPDWDYCYKPLASPSLLDTKGIVRSIAIARDLSFVITASSDSNAYVWELTSWFQVPVASLPHSWMVLVVLISPNMEFAVTCSKDGLAKIWDPSDWGWEVAQLEHEGWVASAAISPDGTYLVTASYDAIVRIWSTASWRLVTSVHHDRHTSNGLVHHSRKYPHAAAISSEGSQSYVITASFDGTSRILPLGRWLAPQRAFFDSMHAIFGTLPSSDPFYCTWESVTCQEHIYCHVENQCLPFIKKVDFSALAIDPESPPVLAVDLLEALSRTSSAPHTLAIARFASNGIYSLSPLPAFVHHACLELDLSFNRLHGDAIDWAQSTFSTLQNVWLRGNPFDCPLPSPSQLPQNVADRNFLKAYGGCEDAGLSMLVAPAYYKPTVICYSCEDPGAALFLEFELSFNSTMTECLHGTSISVELFPTGTATGFPSWDPYGRPAVGLEECMCHDVHVCECSTKLLWQFSLHANKDCSVPVRTLRISPMQMGNEKYPMLGQHHFLAAATMSGDIVGESSARFAFEVYSKGTADFAMPDSVATGHPFNVSVFGRDFITFPDSSNTSCIVRTTDGPVHASSVEFASTSMLICHFRSGLLHPTHPNTTEGSDTPHSNNLFLTLYGQQVEPIHFQVVAPPVVLEVVSSVVEYQSAPMVQLMPIEARLLDALGGNSAVSVYGMWDCTVSVTAPDGLGLHVDQPREFDRSTQSALFNLISLQTPLIGQHELVFAADCPSYQGATATIALNITAGAPSLAVLENEPAFTVATIPIEPPLLLKILDASGNLVDAEASAHCVALDRDGLSKEMGLPGGRTARLSLHGPSLPLTGLHSPVMLGGYFIQCSVETGDGQVLVATSQLVQALMPLYQGSPAPLSSGANVSTDLVAILSTAPSCVSYHSFDPEDGSCMFADGSCLAPELLARSPQDAFEGICAYDSDSVPPSLVSDIVSGGIAEAPLLLIGGSNNTTEPNAFLSSDGSLHRADSQGVHWPVSPLSLLPGIVFNRPCSGVYLLSVSVPLSPDPWFLSITVQAGMPSRLACAAIYALAVDPPAFQAPDFQVGVVDIAGNLLLESIASQGFQLNVLLAAEHQDIFILSLLQQTDLTAAQDQALEVYSVKSFHQGIYTFSVVGLLPHMLHGNNYALVAGGVCVDASICIHRNSLVPHISMFAIGPCCEGSDCTDWFARRNTSECHLCPKHALCDGTVDFNVSDNYWRSGPDSLQLFECGHIAVPCQGNTATGECIDYHEGPLCGSCEVGAARPFRGGVCSPCRSIWQSLLTVLAMVVALAVVAAYMVATALSDTCDSLGEAVSESPTDDPTSFYLASASSAVQKLSAISMVWGFVSAPLSALSDYTSIVASTASTGSAIPCLFGTNLYHEVIAMAIFPVLIPVLVVPVCLGLRWTAASGLKRVSAPKNKHLNKLFMKLRSLAGLDVPYRLPVQWQLIQGAFVILGLAYGGMISTFMSLFDCKK